MDDAIVQALQADNLIEVAPSIKSARDSVCLQTLLSLLIEGTSGLVTLLGLPWPSLDVANQQGLTPLLIAATKGHAALVSLLLEHGAGIDFATSSQQTALFMAVAHARVDVVELLLRFRANPNAPNKHGETPLFASVKRGLRENHELIWNLLLGAGATVHHRNKEARSLLSTAIHTENHHERMVSLVLSTPPPVPVLSEGLWHALPYPNFLALLLAADADPNLQNYLGSTPLHDAIGDQTSPCRLLGAGDQEFCRWGTRLFHSPLPLAIYRRVYDLDIVRRLLQHGADPRFAADDSLYIAIDMDRAAIVALLAPLVEVNTLGHRQIVRYLLQTIFPTSTLETRDLSWQPDATLEAAYALLWCGFGTAKPLAYTQVELTYMNALYHALNQPQPAPQDLLAEELTLLEAHCVTPLGFVPNTAYGVSHCDDVDVTAIALAL
ncbi:hypothetical protein SPRG_03438 [Saprolegnia parasitica CBS 223.65]|uniref:Uncharacterized protein n=1 Tax=Saprolegnia parasitica (strain CBS 223.65) TaxID=695850 RepID=A0A067CXH1_SAPPC|nr:hypothetical protein SPRG_03438 [Saprolegnia parasitica CBS 223.65]KDO31512.1 hypothetical protein SPRG_03438 [Saprolegnia parasitica CBS 223.65]|eukprot:XP_012197422.1 hypothetical protein SPRG_03438 [Saprolegnia parasitica CBS 223.65]